MSDFDDVLKPTTLCAFCPKLCRFACPVAEAESRESVTPWSKMSLVYFAAGGEDVLDDEYAQKVIEACTGCGACTENCAHGNPVSEVLASARQSIETQRVQSFRKAFDETGHVTKRDFDILHEVFHSKSTEDVAYFPGCARSHDGEAAIQNDLEVLSRATGKSVELVTLPKGKRCCGYPLFADGDEARAEQAVLAIEDAAPHVTKLITPDPGCVFVFRKFAKRIEVISLVEAAAENSGAFDKAASGTEVRYHDPCYLGRRRGIYEAPRRLLAQATGEAVVEFAESKECAGCSGAGGLYPVSHPEGAKSIAVRLAGESSLPVVTPCPSARRNFERAGVSVIDLAELLLGKIESRKVKSVDER